MPTSPFPPDTFTGGPGADAATPPGYGPPRKPPADLAAQLREWTDILIRGRWVILAAIAAMGIPFALKAALAPDMFEASARLYVETQSGDPLDGILSGDGSNGGFGQDRAIANEIYVLQYAEDLAQETARELLARGEAPGGAQLSILETPSGQPPSVDELADRIGSYVTVTQDGRAVDAVRVTATSEVPAEAALIANLYAQSYVTRTRSTSRASVSASREFLENQADSVDVELTQREELTRQYMNREDAVRLDEEATSLVTQLAELEAGRDQASVAAGMERARADELRSQIRQLKGNLATRLGSGTDREIKQDEARLAVLRERLDTIYLNNPSLRNAPSSSPQIASQISDYRRQIDTLEDRIQSASSRLVGESIAAGGVSPEASGLPRLAALEDRLTEAEVSLRGYQSQLAVLGSRIASRRADLSRIPNQTVELARLVRDRESAEKLALGLNTRLQETRVQESSELGYADVVRMADVPTLPVSPNRPRTVLMGLLLGLALGVVLAVGRARLDQTLRRPEQVRDLGYPVLGTIPDMTTLINEDFGGAETVNVGDWDVDSRLVMLLSPLATASESFRSLRTSIQFSRPDTVISTLLVTSASPSEGKSTVAANLAIAMAQSGRRTLLLDADLRRPRTHRVFGLPRTPGMTDALVHGGEARPTTVADDLDVLTAGSSVPNPAEHLSSKALRDLLETYKGIYDVVVIDAPPVMAATDPVLLSTQVDATIVVAAAGKTKVFELQYAVDEILNVGGHMIGIAVNRFDVSKEYGYRYQYVYRYGQKYSYGHDEA